MFIEIKEYKTKKKYYLSHTYRIHDKVKKLRRYLGANLSKEKLEKIRKIAEEQINARIKLHSKIADPLLEIMSEDKIKEIKELELKNNLKVIHLNKEDWKTFAGTFAYNTNAIEGSQLSENEVEGILKNNKWPKDKTKEDIAEAQGVAEAIEYIKNTKEHVSINLIKEIHKIVFKNSKEYAGKIRPKGIEVVVENSHHEIIHRGAPSEKVNDLLKELIIWYNKYKNKYPALLLACVVHNQFENIHPFEDGNGRVGRILLNNILLKHKLPPVNIELKNQMEYYQVLREYQENSNVRPSIDLILKEYKELKKMLKK